MPSWKNWKWGRKKWVLSYKWILSPLMSPAKGEIDPQRGNQPHKGETHFTGFIVNISWRMVSWLRFLLGPNGWWSYLHRPHGGWPSRHGPLIGWGSLENGYHCGCQDLAYHWAEVGLNSDLCWVLVCVKPRLLDVLLLKLGFWARSGPGHRIRPRISIETVA